MKFVNAVLLSLLFHGGILPAQIYTSKAQASHAGHRIISGTVLNAATGQPVVDADVSLTDSDAGPFSADIASDSEGHFIFANLYDGKFSLQIQHRGYVASGFEEHEGFFTGIVTGDGLDSENLKFMLAPQAVISGTITDEAGDPVAQAAVQLFRQDDRSGREEIVHAQNVVADDLGNYEFSRLAAGTYFLAVAGTPWYATHAQPRLATSTSSPLDVAFPMAYYSGATNSDDATPIPVKASDRITINETLNAEPAVHIKLSVPTPSPTQGMPLPQLTTKVFGAMESTQQQMPAVFREDANGGSGTTVLDLSDVPPGSYQVEIMSLNGGQDGVAQVDASSGAASVDASKLEPLADVDGKLAMDDGSALPAHLAVSFVPDEGETKTAGVNAEGAFNVHGIAAGEYRVIATGPKGEFAVKQLTGSSDAVDGTLVKIGSSSLTLTAIIAECNTAVRGIAMRNGKPAAGMMIVLIPADGNHEAYRRDQSDSDGSFVLKQVMPGRYTAVAIEDGWALEWARGEVMERYAAQGQKVVVTLHEKDIQLKNSLIVQSR